MDHDIPATNVLVEAVALDDFSTTESIVVPVLDEEGVASIEVTAPEHEHVRIA